MNKILIICLLLISAPAKSQGLEPNDSLALMKVVVKDFNEHPLKNEIILFEDSVNGRTFKGISAENGTFELLVPKSQTYIIRYLSLGDRETYDKITIPDANALITTTLTIKIEFGKTYTLKNLLFDTGKSTIKPSSYTTLNDLAEVLQLKKNLYIEIAGHTDSIANDNFNLQLSEARAEAVKKYLVKKGISPERITAAGYGESEPVADNGTEEGRALNRRTEVRIIKE